MRRQGAQQQGWQHAGPVMVFFDLKRLVQLGMCHDKNQLVTWLRKPVPYQVFRCFLGVCAATVPGQHCLCMLLLTQRLWC
jgi:hypothetical protein